MKYSFSYIESMVVNYAVELRMPNIIHSNGGPIILAHIAAQISDALSPDIAWLARIMNLLVRRGIFAPMVGPDKTSSSASRAPRGACAVKSGRNAFERAHKKSLWESLVEDSKWNVLYNDGMVCASSIMLRAIVAEYGQEVFGGLRSIVDLGGGTGAAVREIIKSYPNIEGINFDLPHVIATTVAYPGVSHVVGDAFKSVPNADAILMKWFLHSWSDEECVKIMKNCHKALPKESGKVIIVDFVLEPRGESLFDDVSSMIDISLSAISNGRARSESEWKKVLEEAGFSNCKFTKTTTFATSIVEAYPH